MPGEEFAEVSVWIYRMACASVSLVTDSLQLETYVPHQGFASPSQIPHASPMRRASRGGGGRIVGICHASMVSPEPRAHHKDRVVETTGRGPPRKGNWGLDRRRHIAAGSWPDDPPRWTAHRIWYMERTRLTADDTADYLVWLAHEHGSFISNLKLQKLLYYAQAWHLAVFDRPLFTDRLEAWVHGPVVPSVYRRFKSYGFRSIDEPVDPPKLSAVTARFLRELADRYLGLDAYALELMTHREDPWLNARGNLPSERASRARISEEDMRAYFKDRMRRTVD
jgi:uncharacterized phage-associated protein